MALYLRIVSEQRRTLGARSAVMLGVAGGSIGRAADNDLVLPDPSLFVSGHHARISFREGRYFLEDRSTNGTWVNEADAPLPRRKPVALDDGDILRLGEYHVLVSLPRAAPRSAGAANGMADGHPDTLDDRDCRPGLEALARGAGLDPARLGGASAAATLQLAGRLLREALQGLKDLDQHRAETRTRAGLSERPGPSDEVTPNLGWGTDALFARLLLGPGGALPAPERWLRQQFESLRGHEEAQMAAARSAFREVIAQLSPRELEERLALVAGLDSQANTDSPTWELYREFYRDLTAYRGNSDLPQAYVDACARAYAGRVAETQRIRIAGHG